MLSIILQYEPIFISLSSIYIEELIEIYPFYRWRMKLKIFVSNGES